MTSATPHPKPHAVTRSRHWGRSALREYWQSVAIAVLLALFIRTFVVQAFKIPSGSMLPTLQVGDHILVNKLMYGLRLPLNGTRLLALGAPHRGDVVVFVHPLDSSKDFIKRVVGVAGEVVSIRGTRVYINGEMWDDPAAYFAEDTRATERNTARDNYGPVTVPPGHILTLGDNRDHSYDSRFWGFVDVDDVKGKAVLIYWSWDRTDRGARWDRLGALIH